MKGTDSAFPLLVPGNDPVFNAEMRDGLDVRTYLSARAMQGLLANPSLDLGAERTAEIAVEHTDALLKRLEQKEDGGPSDARTANTRILAALGMLQRDEPNVEAARALLKDHADRILTQTGAGKEVRP